MSPFLISLLLGALSFLLLVNLFFRKDTQTAPAAKKIGRNQKQRGAKYKKHR